jgi:hypothetical protein
MTVEYRVTSLRLPVDALRWLKVEALNTRTSMAKVAEEVIAAYRRTLGYGDGYRSGGLPCPACQERAYYVRRLDRFIHADGSANEACWRALITGAVPGVTLKLEVDSPDFV